MTTTNKNSVRVSTPEARAMWCSIVEPDNKGQYPTGKYKVDLYMKIGDFEEGKPGYRILEAVTEVASKHYGKQVKFGECAASIVRVESLPADQIAKLPEILREGYIRIKAKSGYKPGVVDAKRNEMTDTEIGNIGNGDKVVAVLDVYPYSQQGGGVAFGLSLIQFIEHKSKSEDFGGARTSGIEMLSDVEVKAESLTGFAGFLK